jgi:hypothetical protein
MTKTTFDDPSEFIPGFDNEKFDADKDPYAVIISPSAPDRAYDYTVADALLDVRSRIGFAIEVADPGRDDAYVIGLRVALTVVDDVLGEHTSGRIALDTLPPVD